MGLITPGNCPLTIRLRGPRPRSRAATRCYSSRRQGRPHAPHCSERSSPRTSARPRSRSTAAVTRQRHCLTARTRCRSPDRMRSAVGRRPCRRPGHPEAVRDGRPERRDRVRRRRSHSHGERSLQMRRCATRARNAPPPARDRSRIRQRLHRGVHRCGPRTATGGTGRSGHDRRTGDLRQRPRSGVGRHRDRVLSWGTGPGRGSGSRARRVVRSANGGRWVGP